MIIYWYKNETRVRKEIQWDKKQRNLRIIIKGIFEKIGRERKKKKVSWKIKRRRAIKIIRIKT